MKNAGFSMGFYAESLKVVFAANLGSLGLSKKRISGS
jgi:hypothetical protein